MYLRVQNNDFTFEDHGIYWIPVLVARLREGSTFFRPLAWLKVHLKQCYFRYLELLPNSNMQIFWRIIE